jgi:hypothetical protein
MIGAIAVVAWGFLGGTTLAQPANDECAGAIPAFDGANAPGTNVGATTSPPAWTCASGGADVWFAYVATCTGTAEFSLCSLGTTYDTTLAVYSGACGALSLLDCSDNACLDLSSVSVPIAAGATYYVRVGGVDLGGMTFATGTFVLTITCFATLTNDECAGAIPVVDGLNAPGHNVGATTSAPAWTCTTAGADVWFSYVASCTGTAQFSLCPPGSASFDSTLAVYSGACGALSLLACNNNACSSPSSVALPVSAGTTYYVRIGGVDLGGSNFDSGSFALYITCSPPAANDECAGAIPVSEGTNGPFSNIGATTSIPPGCGISNDVWFTYTATCTGTVLLSTSGPGGADFPTKIQILGGACGSLFSIACGEGVNSVGGVFYSNPSWLVATLAAGTTYSIRVGKSAEFGATTGTFRLTIQPECAFPPVPPNDECAGAIPLTEGLNYAGANLGANTSAPPWVCTTATHDVWYKFTASCSGVVGLSFCPSSAAIWPIRAVEVFEGNCGNLSLVACTFWVIGCLPDMGIPTVAGRDYLVRVGAIGGTTGAFFPIFSPGSASCLPPPSCVLFEEDFESGTLGAYTETTLAGTPAPTLWHAESNCSLTTPIPPQMGSTAAAYNQGDIGIFNYATGASANAGALESPLISGTAGANLVIQFDYARRVGPFPDETLLQVRPAGGSWTTQTLFLTNFPMPATCLPEFLTTVTLSLPSTLSNAPWQHRWVFDTVTGTANDDLGWYIDDVRVFQSVPAGGGSFVPSPTGCGTTNLAATGMPVIGGTVTYSLNGLVGFPLLWIGIGGAGPTPLCPPASCSLGAPLFFVFALPSITLSVPCDPAIIGASVLTQGADIGAPGGCSAGSPAPIPVTVTDTVATTIG